MIARMTSETNGWEPFNPDTLPVGSVEVMEYRLELIQAHLSEESVLYILGDILNSLAVASEEDGAGGALAQQILHEFDTYARKNAVLPNYVRTQKRGHVDT